jgi:hypothetical protein
MFPDYGHDWPLWEAENPNICCNAEPADYVLSVKLTDELRDWQLEWESSLKEAGKPRWQRPHTQTESSPLGSSNRP